MAVLFSMCSRRTGNSADSMKRWSCWTPDHLDAGVPLLLRSASGVSLSWKRGPCSEREAEDLFRDAIRITRLEGAR